MVMAMAVIWTGMAGLSVLFGAGTGKLSGLGQAGLEGAQSAVQLCLSMAGVLCLWSGAAEVMRRSGMLQGLSRLLRPVLRRLYPAFSGDEKTMEACGGNTLSATISMASVKDLGLAVGGDAVAVIKATSVMIAVD